MSYVTGKQLYERMRNVDPELPVPERITGITITLNPFSPVMLEISMLPNEEAAQEIVNAYEEHQLGVEKK